MSCCDFSKLASRVMACSKSLPKRNRSSTMARCCFSSSSSAETACEIASSAALFYVHSRSSGVGSASKTRARNRPRVHACSGETSHSARSLCYGSVANRRRAIKGMNDTRRIEMLRAKYRSLWDAHQILADRNARLIQSGQQPSNEQLINEQRAAEAVQLARAELLAATGGR